MYIKVITVKVKRRRYKYVKVMDTQYTDNSWRKKEVVIATLGKLEDVQISRQTLIDGLNRLKDR